MGSARGGDTGRLVSAAKMKKAPVSILPPLVMQKCHPGPGGDFKIKKKNGWKEGRGSKKEGNMCLWRGKSRTLIRDQKKEKEKGSKEKTEVVGRQLDRQPDHSTARQKLARHGTPSGEMPQ